MLTRWGMLHAAGATSASFIAPRAGTAAPSTVKTAVDYEVPRGACDCHVHVFCDASKFPFAADRVYTPPTASVEDLRALQAALHLERVVIVTPSVYGLDNACTLDAIRQLGSRARGVAVIDASTPASAGDRHRMAETRSRPRDLRGAGSAASRSRPLQPDAILN
jgi:predicted TIM-barrel fold metal-dependent hydrolase